MYRLYFHKPRIEKFIKREKRFFVYIENFKGYCCNTGPLHILTPGALCIFSEKNTGIPYVWEAITYNGEWIGVNTQWPNKLVSLLLKDLYDIPLKSEVKIDNCRFDFGNLDKKIIIEVKNTYLHWEDKTFFPDCVTIRGQKQLKLISKLLDQGYKCHVIYIIQRGDKKKFFISNFDPEYKKLYKECIKKGLKVNAFNCNITLEYIEIKDSMEILDNIYYDQYEKIISFKSCICP